jgi:hypothetical protein
MKFAKYQANNLVPEWRRKYLDVSPHLLCVDIFSTKKERNFSRKSERPDKLLCEFRLKPALPMSKPHTRAPGLTFMLPVMAQLVRKKPIDLQTETKMNKSIRLQNRVNLDDNLLQDQMILDHP